jgi:hypothetical protein
MENTQIYVTSWGSYNEGAGRGGWIDLDVIDEDNFDQRIKEVGLDVKGDDEELVIHDYDDYEFNGFLDRHVGEANPIEVVKFYQKWINLGEQEKVAFIGLIETQSDEEALTALDEDAFTQFCEECLSCNFTADWQLVEKYIDWDRVKSDYSVDYGEFDYNGTWYYIQNK